MSQIEKIYYDWSDEQVYAEELKNAYRNISNTLIDLIGLEKFNEVDEMIMQCVSLERFASFKGGFQQATAIWKECC
ncbi:hypothetical protein [Blautia sp.]|uniref:hypothetical protein n=1 Tax=Blautia sp. TaxID=1955243 RepID=UPI003AF9A0CA